MKLFTKKWRIISSLILVILIATKFQGMAQDCIYFVNWGSIGGAPTVENKDLFIKLNETQKGSRVYNGVVEMQSYYKNYFRFYSELQNCREGDPEFSWHKGNICPGREVEINTIGNSGVFFMDDVKDFKVTPPNMEPGTWCTSDNGTFDVTVDLNKGTIIMVPVDDVLVLVNDSKTPVLDVNKLNDYSTLDKFREYIAPGDIKLSFYSLYRKQWVICEDANLEKGNNKVFYEPNYSDNYQSLSLNWPGGIMVGSQNGQYGNLNLNPDGPIIQNISCDKVYLIGGFCNWSFDGALVFNKTNAEGNLFKVTFPSTDQLEFKITNLSSWEDKNWGYGNKIQKNAAGEYVMTLDYNGDNIKFDTPITNPIEAVLNIAEQTLIFPANAPLTATQSSDWKNEYQDVIFLGMASNPYEIWDDAPYSVVSTYPILRKTGEQEWSGEVYIPSGDFKFNLISELTSKGKANKLIVPNSEGNYEMKYIDGYAFSSAKESVGNGNVYWTTSNWNGGDLTINLTKESNGYVLKVDDAASCQPKKIYLIGQPQGWNINGNSMPLYETVNGGFYGKYYINAGEAMFRFYSQLGDWENYSIGSQYVDYSDDITFTEGLYSSSAINGGKGTWNVIDWQGGEMYLYVGPYLDYVIFSENPIPEAGEVKAEIERNYTKDGIFISFETKYNNLEKEELRDLRNGIHSYNLNNLLGGTKYSDDLSIWIYTKQLPISFQEPEWKGSYVLELSETDLDASDTNFFVTDFVSRDMVSSRPVDPIVIKNTKTQVYDWSVNVDMNNNKIYIANTSGSYVFPYYKYESFPLINKYEEIEPYHVYTGKIIDIPANEFDLWLKTYNDLRATDQVEISFAEDPFIVATNDINFGWSDKRLVSKNWKGGKVYLDTHIAYALSDDETITAYFNGNSKELKQTTPGSLIFKGELEFKKSQNSNNTLNTLSFELARAEKEFDYWGMIWKNTYNIPIGGEIFTGGIGFEVPIEERSVYVDNGKATSKLNFNSYPMVLPNVTEGKFDVTVDLNNMTIEMIQTEGVSTDVYEIVASNENGLDGLVSYADPSSANAVFEAANLEGSNNGYDFNLLNQKGEVITPENDLDIVIEFNEYGIWSGKYRETSSVATRSMLEKRNELRTLASGNGKWHFDLPANTMTNFQMILDENNKTVTMFSSAHNKNFFIAKAEKLEDFILPSIYEVNNGIDILGYKGNGKYRGSIELPVSSENLILAFLKDVRGVNIGYQGITCNTNFYDSNIFDLTSDNETSLWASHRFGDFTSYLYSTWTLYGEPYVYSVEYDENNNTLTVSKEMPLGVEEIRNDITSEISILPGSGYINVISPEIVLVDIYNVTGLKVKSVKVAPGTSTIDLASGIYIVNDKKVIVK